MTGGTPQQLDRPQARGDRFRARVVKDAARERPPESLHVLAEIPSVMSLI